MNRHHVVYIVSIVFPIVFFMCDTGTSPNDNGIPDDNAYISGSAQWALNEETQTMSLFVPTCECTDGNKTPNADPTVELYDYEIISKGNRLVITTGTINSVAIGPDSVTIRIRLEFVRVKGEKTIQGTWHRDTVSFESSLHNVDKDDSVTIWQHISRNTHLLHTNVQYLLIEGSKITLYSIADPVSFAAEFISNWNLYYAAQCSVSVDSVAGDTVLLFGMITQDSVRIAKRANGDISYTHSDTAMSPHTWHAKPDTCPNDRLPSWYIDPFLKENRK